MHVLSKHTWKGSELIKSKSKSISSLKGLSFHCRTALTHGLSRYQKCLRQQWRLQGKYAKSIRIDNCLDALVMPWCRWVERMCGLDTSNGNCLKKYLKALRFLELIDICLDALLMGWADVWPWLTNSPGHLLCGGGDTLYCWCIVTLYILYILYTLHCVHSATYTVNTQSDVQLF